MRKCILWGALAALGLLCLAETAEAQFYRGGRGGVGISIGYGRGYYSSPYYGSGFYGGPTYGRWSPGYYNAPYYGYTTYSRPYYGGYTQPYYYSSGYYPYTGYTYGYPYTNYVSPLRYSSSAYSNGTTQASYAVDTRSGNYQSFYPSNTQDNQVLLRVNVPDNNARVWIDDQPTQQMGLDRLYVSPPVAPGKSYSYTVKASWMQNGQEVTREQKVPVKPGQTATVNFTSAGNEPVRPASTDINDDLRPANPDRNAQPPEQRSAEDRFNERGLNDPIRGEIMKREGNDVTVRWQDSGIPRIYTLNRDAQIMIDGQKEDASALRPGMQVLVTQDPADVDFVNRLEVTGATPTPVRNPLDPGANRNRPDENRPTIPPRTPVPPR